MLRPNIVLIGLLWMCLQSLLHHHGGLGVYTLFVDCRGDEVGDRVRRHDVNNLFYVDWKCECSRWQCILYEISNSGEFEVVHKINHIIMMTTKWIRYDWGPLYKKSVIKCVRIKDKTDQAIFPSRVHHRIPQNLWQYASPPWILDCNAPRTLRLPFSCKILKIGGNFSIKMGNGELIRILGLMTKIGDNDKG